MDQEITKKQKQGFTLIEILTVIGILAVLATATALIINPANMLAQSRDTRRLNDVRKINSAILAQQVMLSNLPSINNTLYISLPDSSPACGTYTLPTLSSGWGYACAPASSYRKNDGSGWIPIDFTSLAATPLPELPIDPKNNQSYFYAYAHGRIITAAMESTKFLRDVALSDGGNDPSRYELGNASVSNQASNLIGYWAFEEGSGTTVADSSGNANNGTLINGPIWSNSGKVGSGLSFDGVNDYVALASPANFNVHVGEAKTFIAWFKGVAVPGRNSTIMWKEGNCIGWYINMQGNGQIRFNLNTGSSCSAFSTYSIISPGASYGDNEWHMAAGVIDRPANRMELYIDGSPIGSSSPDNTNGGSGGNTSIGTNWNNGTPFTGLIDEVRIYNRALSSSEILSIYNAQK